MPAPRNASRLGGGTPLLATLNAAAPLREVNNFVSLDKYYRSAVLMERQAEAYRRARNTEQLYVILLRLVSLVVETIPKHQTFAADSQYIRLRSTCAEKALPELEKLRIELRLKDTKRLEAEPYEPRKVPGAVQISAGNVAGLHWDGSSTVHNNNANSSSSYIAVDPSSDVSILDALGTPEWSAVTASAATAATILPTTTTAANIVSSAQTHILNLPDLSTNIRLPTANQATLAKHSVLPSSSSSSSGNQYITTQAAAVAAAQRPLYPDLAQQQPPPPSPYNELQLGPQEIGVTSAPYPTAPLSPNDTCCPPPSSALAPPASTQQQEVTVPPGGVQPVKKRQQIRDVHISVALMDEFLRFAISNTRRGIETCGILAGSLSADDASFTVSALLVPKQEGTSDTVQALSEEEIFEVQDSRGLYPLGWIHTHPTQTCFMSSVDIHTHCGYQTMLDEAIAIVMAPRDAKTPVGMFRLSTPGGLKLIQQCQLRGFHAHPPTKTGQPIYELCGHVYLNPRAGFEVIDLRDR